MVTLGYGVKSYVGYKMRQVRTVSLIYNYNMFTSVKDQCCVLKFIKVCLLTCIFITHLKVVLFNEFRVKLKHNA